MTLIARKDAIAMGLKRYFTGKPCKHGHVSDRLVSNKYCCQCNDVRRAENSEKNREYHRNRHSKLRDSENARKREYRLNNPDVVSEQSRIQRERHGAKRIAYNKAYRQNKKHIVRAAEARRRAIEMKATPPWISDFDELVFIEAYDLARARSESTGIDWHVDHMIPLAAKSACGLHVAANIQVIPATINRRKMNRMILTEPLQWLGVMQ
jgi:hypothetical protein